MEFNGVGFRGCDVVSLQGKWKEEESCGKE